MEWVVLVVAGIFECIWALELKHSAGFTKFWPSLFFLISLFLSMLLLSISMKSIPIGTAYAVWTGIGAVCVAILGMIFLGDPRSIARIICIMFIVIGIVGLKFFSHA